MPFNRHGLGSFALVSVTFGVLLAGCSGGGSRSTPAVVQDGGVGTSAAANVPTALVHLTFTIPAGTVPSATSRRLQFVDKNIQSAVATAYQLSNPANPPGGSNSTNRISAYLDLSQFSPNCQPNTPVAGARTCSIFLPAPTTAACDTSTGAGCDFFEIDMYTDRPSPSSPCGGSAGPACTAANGFQLAIGTDGNGNPSGGNGNHGYNVQPGSSLSVSLGLQGIITNFFLSAPTTYNGGACPSVGASGGCANYPAPFNSGSQHLFVVSGLAGIGANAAATISSLAGAPFPIDLAGTAIIGSTCTNGDLFANGITTNAHATGGNDFAADGPGGTNQVQVFLQPCGTSGFQNNPAQGMNTYFSNDQLQGQYLGGGGAGNEETVSAPYYGFLTESTVVTQSAPLAADWLAPPATAANAWPHPYPLNPTPGCGPGSTSCIVSGGAPKVNLLLAPLFAQTFQGATGANENDSAAGGPNPGHAVLALAGPGSSGRIYADQLIKPSGGTYSATLSSGCSAPLNGTMQSAATLSAATILTGAVGAHPGYGAMWSVTAGNLSSNGLGNTSSSCVITVSDGFNSVQVWVANSVGNGGTIVIPPIPQLFVANIGGPYTVSAYPLSNLTTNSPTIISNGINGPEALAFDSSGNLFVANYFGGNVAEYLPGNYAAPATTISGATYRIATDASGDLFVTSGFQVSFYSAGHYTAPSAVFSSGVQNADALALNSSSDLFVANKLINTGPGSVTVYPSSNYTTASPTVITTGVNFPVSLAVDASGNLFVGNCAQACNTGIGPSTVTVYPAGNYTTASPTVISNGISYLAEAPQALALGASGNLFVANVGNNTVTVYPAGNYTTASPTVISNGINFPQALIVDSSGNLFVANIGNNTVTEYLFGNYTGAPVVIHTGINGPFALAIH